MTWTIVTLDAEVDAELEALPADQYAKFLRISEMIEGLGLPRMREPYVKPLQDGLWEIRMIGRDGISRALYVTATGKRVIVVRVFSKKTRKTPLRKITIALKRARKVT